MLQPERTLWKWLDRRMGNAWVAQRVESTGTAPGIPDVYFSCKSPDLRGWIELKSMRSWGPDQNPFDVLSWTPDQRNWARRHHAAAGRTWLLVEVREHDEVLLVSSEFALEKFGWYSVSTMRNSLHVLPKRTLGAKEILDALARA